MKSRWMFGLKTQILWKKRRQFLCLLRLSRLLEQEVVMAQESSLRAEELKQMAVCLCNPLDLEIRLSPGAGAQNE